MFRLLKRNAEKQHKTTNGHVHYGAFGNAMATRPTQKGQLTKLAVTQKSNDLMATNNEHQLARALSYQMHQALNQMNQQLTEREARIEERFIALRLAENTHTTTVAPKSKKGLFIIGGILAATTMIYLLFIMQNMQTSMQSMSGDIKGMTQDITDMSTNTNSMANNMQTMNQGVSGMNQQIGNISDSIEPMGDVAKNVSPFARMFNQFSPF